MGDAAALDAMMHDGLLDAFEGVNMVRFGSDGARESGISREEQDEYAVRSHRRAAAARDDGRFAEEIVPVTVRGRKGDVVVDADEHIRADSSVEKLAGLRPILGKDDPEATVTALTADDGSGAPPPPARVVHLPTDTAPFTAGAATEEGTL